MNASRRVAVACLVAVLVAGAIGWALQRGPGDAPARIADGARVRTGSPIPTDAAAVEHAPKALPELGGSKPVDATLTRGRRHTLAIVVEGPAGVIPSATVTVESNEPFGIEEPSIELPAPQPKRRTPTAEVRSTDATGRTTFVVYGNISASVSVAAEGFMPRSTTHWFDDEGAAKAVEEERVRLEPGAKIEGTIVDAASGAPIVAAEVRAGGDSDEPDTVSDERGSFRFWVDMSTRALKVHVRADGFGEAESDLALWNGLVIDPPIVTIRLHRRHPGPRGTIEVTVLDASERPVEGALVWAKETYDRVVPPPAEAEPESDAEVGAQTKVKTDSEGRGLVPDVRIGRPYRVFASRHGHVDGHATSPVRLDAGQTTGHAIVVLEDLGSLVVTVLDPAGEPVTGYVDFRADLEREPGGEVADFDAVESLWRLLHQRPSNAVGAGTYRFAPVAPGKLRLSADVDGYLSAESSLEIHAGKETALTLRLGKGVTIRGTVVDREGHPVAGAGVQAVKASEPADDDLTLHVRVKSASGSGAFEKSDADGRFALRGLAAGTYRLEAGLSPGPDGYTEFEGSLDVAAPSDDVRVVVDRLASVHGKLVLPDGTPFQGEVGLGTGSLASSHFTRQTIDEGAFTLGGFRDGEHLIVISVPGWPTLEAPLTIRDGLSVELGNVQLDEGAALRGRIVDAAGSPVGSASVSVEGESAASREDGSFEFAHVARGRHELSATHEAFVETTVVVELTKDAGPVVVRLSRGGVVRGVLKQGGTEREFRLRFAREGNGDPFDREMVVATPRPDARYFVVLPLGRWEALWHTIDDDWVVIGKVKVEEDKIQDLDLDASPK